MLSPTCAVMGRGLGKDIASITDGRFSGGTHGLVVGHITPEAFEGGPLAIVKDDDPITIDAVERTVNLDLPAQVIQSRLARWRKPKPRYRRGVLVCCSRHYRLHWGRSRILVFNNSREAKSGAESAFVTECLRWQFTRSLNSSMSDSQFNES
jgi:hypothetical protein